MVDLIFHLISFYTNS